MSSMRRNSAFSGTGQICITLMCAGSCQCNACSCSETGELLATYGKVMPPYIQTCSSPHVSIPRSSKHICATSGTLLCLLFLLPTTARIDIDIPSCPVSALVCTCSTETGVREYTSTLLLRSKRLSSLLPWQKHILLQAL